jgi:hypothetical protein
LFGRRAIQGLRGVQFARCAIFKYICISSRATRRP